MSTAHRLLLIVAATAAIAGCSSALQPYETVPMAAPPGDARQRVGVCFDGLASTPEEVRAVAQAACAPHTVAERVDTDYEIQYCPLLQPGRATFACAPHR